MVVFLVHLQCHTCLTGHNFQDFFRNFAKGFKVGGDGLGLLVILHQKQEGQYHIQDFPEGDLTTKAIKPITWANVPENYAKRKKIWHSG